MNEFLFRLLLISLGGTLPYPAAASAAEPPRYQIQATVDVGQKKLTAQQTVHFTNTSSGPVGEIYFHIYPHRKYTIKEKNFMLRYAGYFKVNPYPDGFQSGDMDIQTVKSGADELAFTIEGTDQTLLKVNLRQSLAAGQAIALSLDFSIEIPHAYGRFGWHEDIIRLSRWYPILAVLTEQGWNRSPFYPFHRPFFSAAADYEVELTVPADEVVIHSGSAEPAITSSGTKTWVIKSTAPIREFSLAMSPRYQKLEGEIAGTKINSFYLPGDEAHARLALEDAKTLMQFYARRFGAYPYSEFSLAPVHLGYGGEQMSNMIFIDTRVYQLPRILDRYFDFLIAHETGHQWFYNWVGMNEYTEMWLEEGVNSYFIAEYLEDKYGQNTGIVQYPSWFKGWEWTLPHLTFQRTRDFRYKMITRMGYDNKVVGELASFSEPSSIFSLTYGKGARVVGMLKTYLGEEVFDRIFRKIFSQHSFGNLSIAQFIRTCEEESGRDLSGFFAQWLQTAKKFDYAVAAVHSGNIVLENRGGIEMPAEVEIVFSDGHRQTLVWDGKTRSQAIPLDSLARVRSVAIDREEKLLDVDRTNNFWPRQVHFKPVPLYLGLYDIPVFLPDDGYNVVIGPELANSGIGVKASVQKPFDQIFYGATDYELGEDLLHSRIGYQLKNVLRSPTTLGFEMENTTDYDEGEEDLVSGKAYLRRELWPAQYGLVDINDHATLYLIRNQGLNDSTEFFSGREDTRNIDYSRRNEAIIGGTLHFDRSGPYPDPVRGYKVDTFYENAGHFFNATQAFHRSGLDVGLYQPVTARSRVAARLKYGWGYPDDRDLFHLGGVNGLRGYERKTVRGSNVLLGSLEYRFPIKDGLKIYVLDHLFGLESVGGVVFVDAGQGWFDNFEDARLRKDAGAGLRLTVNVGSFLEKVVVRLDVAKAINDSAEDTRFWFGVNHAF